MKKDALISMCGDYRYTLYREWDETRPNILFIMLNPSTADASIDDPTISRCISIAKHNGFGSLAVGNMYAYRATDPNVLKTISPYEVMGPFNHGYLQKMIEDASKVVVGWGRHGKEGNEAMRQFLQFRTVYCLKINKDGTPKHPLYCKVDSELIEWGKMHLYNMKELE